MVTLCTGSYRPDPTGQDLDVPYIICVYCGQWVKTDFKGLMVKHYEEKGIDISHVHDHRGGTQSHLQRSLHARLH